MQSLSLPAPPNPTSLGAGHSGGVSDGQGKSSVSPKENVPRPSQSSMFTRPRACAMSMIATTRPCGTPLSAFNTTVAEESLFARRSRISSSVLAV